MFHPVSYGHPLLGLTIYHDRYLRGCHGVGEVVGVGGVVRAGGVVKAGGVVILFVHS